MKKIFEATFDRTIEANGHFHTTKMKRKVRAINYGDALARIRKLWGYEVSNIQILPPKKRKVFFLFRKKK